jgi:hypothetical protein
MQHLWRLSEFMDKKPILSKPSPTIQSSTGWCVKALSRNSTRNVECS